MKRLIIIAIILQLIIRAIWIYFGDDFYYLGMSIIMLLWAIAFQISISGKFKIFINWWLFWIANDVLKEASNYSGILKIYFGNPTQKYLSEYIIFGISTLYLIYELRWKKYRPG